MRELRGLLRGFSGKNFGLARMCVLMTPFQANLILDGPTPTFAMATLRRSGIHGHPSVSRRNTQDKEEMISRVSAAKVNTSPLR